jgi:hypothetical protein
MAEGSAVTLQVVGASGARVEGVCHLRSKDGVTTVQIAATVPLSHTWRADGARCELRASGPVTVEISGGGSRSRTSTSGGVLVVEVR